MEVNAPRDKRWNGHWLLSQGSLRRTYPEAAIRLQDNLRSLQVLSHSAAVAGGDKLTRAAAGAVLGFLVAGPVGTVLGAGAGAGGRQHTAESFRIIVAFKSGEVLLGDVSPFELEQLRQHLPAVAEVSASPNAAKPAAVKVVKVAKPAGPTNSALPPPIKGRKTKARPFGNRPLLEQLGDPAGNETLALFHRFLTQALDSLNTFKWRHLDGEIDYRDEVAACMLLAVSVTAGHLAYASNPEKLLVRKVETLIADIAAAHSRIAEAEAEYKRRYTHRGAYQAMTAKVEAARADAEEHQRALEEAEVKLQDVQRQSTERPSQEAVLRTYLGDYVTHGQFDDAWAHPLVSAAMSLARAARILLIKKRRSDGEQDEARESMTARATESALAIRLLDLKNLLDRELISPEEYRSAREKALGL